MVYVPGLEPLLETLSFRPMTEEEYDTAVKSRRYVLKAQAYPDAAWRHPLPPMRRQTVTPETWCKTFPDMNPKLFPKFRDLMILTYQVDPGTCRSLAEFGALLLHPHLLEVPELTGFPAQFIGKCMNPPLLGPAFGVPIRIDGELTLLDRCSSYPAVYVDFPGIPIGLPRVIRDWSERGTYAYYYVEVKLKVAICKEPSDPYPLVGGPGTYYWGKTWMSLVEQYYQIEYEFVGGYYFTEVRNPLINLTQSLWNLRRELLSCKDPLQLWVKRLMNTWWGKSMMKLKPIKEVWDIKGGFGRWKQHPHVYSYRTDGRVRLVHSILAAWQRPQFGVNVLEWSR
jgi:hypothetical protein